MAKIQDKSIFGEYNNAENRITAAFLHIIRAGGENIIRYVFGNKGVEIPDNDIVISTQETSGAGVADGKICCNFSFDIQIESKIKGNINDSQLDRYKEIKSQSNSRQLVYFIPDNTHNVRLLQGIPYFTWTELDVILDEYLKEYDGIIGEVEKYLINQFKILLENYDLIDKAANRVIVVGGAFGEEIAKKYKFYICQNNRFFKNAQYLAFYHKKAISSVFRIEEGYPRNDINLKDQTLGLSEDFFEKYEKYYNEKDVREVFKLSEEITIPNNIIKHEVHNRKFYPFVRKQKYVSFTSIQNAKYTSELEDWN